MRAFREIIEFTGGEELRVQDVVCDLRGQSRCFRDSARDLIQHGLGTLRVVVEASSFAVAQLRCLVMVVSSASSLVAGSRGTGCRSRPGD
jgi:hypothetical protein